jgi:hypothetical protein
MNAGLSLVRARVICVACGVWRVACGVWRVACLIELPDADMLHYYRQAFARRYSTSRHSNSALSAAVSDVKLFIKFLLDFLVNLADDLSFFEMKARPYYFLCAYLFIYLVIYF